MPVKSEAQRRAMYAALEGHSTLGIPKSVAKKFVGPKAHDALSVVGQPRPLVKVEQNRNEPEPPRTEVEDAEPFAAGVMISDPEGRVLFLRRSSAGDHANEWAFPGGKIEEGENPADAARRECREEIGHDPGEVTQHHVASNGYVTHRASVSEAFRPELNDEHTSFSWRKPDEAPEPLHPGVRAMLSNLKKDSKSLAQDEGWVARHPAVSVVAMDRSVRTFDEDGHLRVETTPISKANVCPYYGSEIPDAEKMGLDPRRMYKLYRDPEELRKGAATFAGKPLLRKHVPITADDHPRDLVVGSIGDSVSFDHPYLKAPLSVWDGDAIDLIKSGKQRELSSAYRFRADMTPGVSKDGEPYDGVMRDIVGNHVALVENGRAGSDVVVGDSAVKKQHGIAFIGAFDMDHAGSK